MGSEVRGGTWGMAKGHVMSSGALVQFLVSIGADEVASDTPLPWWAPPKETAPVPAVAPIEAAPPLKKPDPLVSFSSLQALRAALDTVTDFALKQTATQMVFGEGPLNPDIMVIGEAPGNEEDQSGRPFVDSSGQLLNQILAAAGYAREHCYITTIIPWRPPGNRAPTPHEVAQMLPFLREHIRLVAPKAIILLGGVVAKAVLNNDTSMMRLRGRLYPLEGTDIVVAPTFHPASLLRTPSQKQQVWEDVLRLKQHLAGGHSLN